MICVKAEIPKEVCDIDDELKAIYHSKDTVCIWVFKTREQRNKFMDETIGMMKDDRQLLLAHASSSTNKIYTHPNFDLASQYVNKVPMYDKVNSIAIV